MPYRIGISVPNSTPDSATAEPLPGVAISDVEERYDHEVTEDGGRTANVNRRDRPGIHFELTMPIGNLAWYKLLSLAELNVVCTESHAKQVNDDVQEVDVAETTYTRCKPVAFRRSAAVGQRSVVVVTYDKPKEKPIGSKAVG